MKDRRVTLPDLSSVETTFIQGFSVELDAREVLLWIQSYEAKIPLLRVFCSEGEAEVAVLVVRPTGHLKQGWTGDWLKEDIDADVAPVVVTLQAPLGTRGLVDGKSGRRIGPLPKRIWDRYKVSGAR